MNFVLNLHLLDILNLKKTYYFQRVLLAGGGGGGGRLNPSHRRKYRGNENQDG